MSFRTKRIIFITPFYIIFEFFLLKYIFLLLGGIDDVCLIILAVLIGLNHLLPMFFEAKKSRRTTRFLTTLDGVWMWASVMFLIDIVLIYLAGFLMELSSAVIYFALLIVPVLGVYNYFKAHKIKINEKTMVFDDLKREIAIAHMSDIHFGSVRHKEIISQIAGKLKELENICDLAIISGDLADGSSVVEENDFMALKEVEMPVIFTPGNHDFYPGIESVIRACKKADIIVLDNESVELSGLNIYGLTFSFGDRNPPEIDESVIKPDLINIINYHVPYYWEEFSRLGFDIQLSGHTHGGQFFPAVNFANILFEYNMGLFKDNSGNYLHVTTGVGSMDTPMRWGTDSEIVILKLKKS